MNRRIWFVATCAILFLSQNATAHVIHFYTEMSGALENPVNNSEGTGSSHVYIDLDLFTMRVVAEFSGLTGTTSAVHIHCCQIPPTNAIVATITPSFTGFPLGVTAGTYDHTYDMSVAGSYNSAFITANGGTVSSAFQAFFDAMSNNAAGKQAYLNIHTSFRGGGEIRGFYSVIPEPASALLALVGLGIPVLLRRSR